MSNCSPSLCVDPAVIQSEFVSSLAPQNLRVCCYGSSSAKTPEKYLQEARALGYILARRGHTCVNGAGSFGCMAAMNDGAAAGNGHIIGVIHEMFVVDGSDWCVRDGGAHNVFHKTNPDERQGPLREILVAGGEDLQERKKLLVQGADALVVLPGGPGTWDELWEMACARNIGLTNIPIVVVNADNYYSPFREQLERSYKDDLIKLKPHEVVHFVDTAEEAVRWIEDETTVETSKQSSMPKLKRRASVLRSNSFMVSPSIVDWFRESLARPKTWDTKGMLGHEELSWAIIPSWAVPFAAGLAIGFTLTSVRNSKA